MSGKTNKSFTKRLKITRTGKILAKTPGGDHFNAKESRSKQLKRKKWREFAMSKKARARFINS